LVPAVHEPPDTLVLTVDETFHLAEGRTLVALHQQMPNVPVGRRLLIHVMPLAGPTFHARASVDLPRTVGGNAKPAVLRVEGRATTGLSPGSRVRVPVRPQPDLSCDELAVQVHTRDLRDPWMPADGPSFAEQLARELPHEHVLYSVEVRASARRQDRDDVLFATELIGAPFVVIHLTYGRSVNPAWPTWTPYPSLESWLQHGYSVDVAKFNA
jgi:hypothetical protein